MAAQLELRVIRPAVAVNYDVIPTLKDLHHAVSKCAEIAGSQDKSVCADTGVDASTWSKLKDGSAGIKGDFLERLMDACGNELPLLWLLYRRGYDPRSIRKRESELERQLREEREARAKLEGELEIIKQFVRDTGRAA